jgi:MOSC domain-containing protein YiiM
VSLAAEAPRRVPALSVVDVLSATEADSIVATPVPVLELDFGGVVGDRHHGLTRPADTRQLRYYPRGTMIRNRRQLTLVSVEELAEVANRLGVPEVKPGWLGANLLVEGISCLSALPMGTRLLFGSGAGLVCEGVNQPCRLPAQVIQQQYGWSRAEAEFVKAAYGRRGIAASVECPGPIIAGDQGSAVPPEVHVEPRTRGLRVARAARVRDPRSALRGAERQSGDELLLQQEEHDDGRQRHQHRAG